ncbi:hypothetical protein FG167_09000 [Lacinutrix sp. WUR7]|uniref:DUF6134 family protein n=1 Tax=Lacinutrix sp. WUR7 TaxID=2653681 RepID=UPI00193D9E41|nr:DUF6134 family protein [Lacinutrix sp. WUR7]QRM89368.1 hypothetical protein FG167_09000 [Lacinutrix sp. WUR7]
MIWYLIIFHVLSFHNLNLNTNDTHLKFDIVLKEKIVGQLQASKTFKDSKIHYQSATNISTRFITDLSVNYKYNVVFNNHNLKKADVYITINNKPHAETSTEWQGDHYLIKQNDDKARFYDETINYSTILMYFEEPKDVVSCFSEEDGSINTIIPLGDHTYKKVNAKGKENIYYYKKGKLIRAEIDGGLISFQMIAK